MTSPSTVLVVEDNDFVRMQLIRFLEEGGFAVLEAKDGMVALDLLKTNLDVQVLILDLRMQPIDGLEVIKALQSQGRNIPVVVVTGDQNPDLLAEAARWHVSAVLMKPVQKDRLVKMVSRAIEHYNRR